MFQTAIHTQSTINLTSFPVVLSKTIIFHKFFNPTTSADDEENFKRSFVHAIECEVTEVIIRNENVLKFAVANFIPKN